LTVDRFQILTAAADLTGGDRLTDYGEPKANLWAIAQFWSVQIGDKLKPGERITAREAPLMLALLKFARARTSPDKLDTYNDAAAYVAIAGECAEIEE